MHLHIGLRFKLAIFNAKQTRIVYFGKNLFTIKMNLKTDFVERKLYAMRRYLSQTSQI